MVHVNCATLDGRQYVTNEEKLTAELSIMPHLKYLKEQSTILVSIYGVWVS